MKQKKTTEENRRQATVRSEVEDFSGVNQTIKGAEVVSENCLDLQVTELATTTATTNTSEAAQSTVACWCVKLEKLAVSCDYCTRGDGCATV